MIILCLTDITHEIQHELMSVSLSSFNKDEKMQDDISDCANSELFINEIITHDMIATKNDLEQYELDACKIIHIIIKKCEQFSEKM